jgi:predicted trehalose synthase
MRQVVELFEKVDSVCPADAEKVGVAVAGVAVKAAGRQDGCSTPEGRKKAVQGMVERWTSIVKQMPDVRRQCKDTIEAMERR